ncbi:MAG: hypothetical protein ACYS8Z_07255 [Planctomycetota bacterium]|jgi:hypothetical protein
MEEGRKKQVMIGIIVFCFAAAAYITFSGGQPKPGEMQIDENATVWVRCLNPRCKHIYEMSMLAYREFQREYIAEDSEPGMTCEKCRKPSAYKAEKCLNESCGAVFFFGDAGKDKPSDQCPKCGTVQSQMSEQ